MSTPDFQSWWQAATALPPSHRALKESVIPALLGAVAQIGQALRRSHHVSLAGTANAFGDDQLNVDVISESLIRDCLAACPAVVTASSEEDPVERPVHHHPHSSAEEDRGGDNSRERYTVAFDPLDGSSIIAPNWSVGTIIGIWEGESALGQDPSRKQVAAILGVHGPRTTAVVAVRLPGSTETVCFEVGLSSEEGVVGVAGTQMIRPSVRLTAAAPYRTRYFAPANLRAAADDERYMKLVTHYIENKYTLRYSGGLVPDVVHALVKGHGIYLSPVTAQSKAKLRKLFELFPVALILESAGGQAIDPATGLDILSQGIDECDARGGLICGNSEDVEHAKAMFGLQ